MRSSEKAEENVVVGQGSPELEEGFPEDLSLPPDDDSQEETKVECRICQEEDLLQKMESPCACKGTIKYAHRSCLQKWCNEKQSIFCEICHQKYQRNYIVQLPPIPYIIPCPHHTIVNISEAWAFSGNHPQDVQQAALAAHQFLQDDRESGDWLHAIFRGSRTCHFLVFLIQLALCCIIGLLLAIMTMTSKSSPNRAHEYTVYYIAFGMIIPCYIMAGVSNIMRLLRDRPVTLSTSPPLPNRRQREDEIGVAIAISPRPVPHGRDQRSAGASNQHLII